jgi:hypothetical protein
MKLAAWLILLAAPAVGCGALDLDPDPDPVPMSEDHPRVVAVSGDRVVVAASIEDEATEFGCGGGGDPSFGASVLFVSNDRGITFDRVVPFDDRPLTRLAVRDGVFYGTVQAGFGLAVMTSVDGVSWTEIATAYAPPHDLIASEAGLAVSHAYGLLTSTDGVTWVDHVMTIDGELYAPSVARTSDAIVVGTAADRPLRFSPDAETWTERLIPNLYSVWQLIPAGDEVVIVGTGRLPGGAIGPGIARLALDEVEATPIFSALTGDHHVLLTPSGLLDTGGNLWAVDALTGIGAPVPHIAPFTSGTVDGDLVIILRDNLITISTDGGGVFSTGVSLPVIRTPGSAPDPEPCGGCG